MAQTYPYAQNAQFGLPKNGTQQFAQPADILNGYIDQYNKIPELANQFKTLANDNSAFSQTQNKINDLYGMFDKNTNQYYDQYAKINQGLNQDVLGQLMGMKDTFMNQYGPQGEQTKRLSDYYGALNPYLASQGAKNLAQVDATAKQTGAPVGAYQNAIAQAQQQNLGTMLDFKKQQLADYDNLYKTLNQYLANYIQTYAGSNDKYVRDTYKQLLDYKNSLGSALTQTNAQFEQMKLQDAISKRPTVKATTPTTPTVTPPTGNTKITQYGVPGVKATGSVYRYNRGVNPSNTMTYK